MKKFFFKCIGSFILACGRRKLVNRCENLPDKFVVICAPHTSLWDIVFTLSAMWCLEINFKLVVKKEIIEMPLIGRLVSFLGGLGVDRSNPSGFTEQVVQHIENCETIGFGISPPGTRSQKPNWKMGFYIIAKKANVPVVLAFVDYKTKEIGFGEYFYLSGNVEEDFARFAKFYDQITPGVPEKKTPVIPPPGWSYKEEKNETHSAK